MTPGAGQRGALGDADRIDAGRTLQKRSGGRVASWAALCGSHQVRRRSATGENSSGGQRTAEGVVGATTKPLTGWPPRRIRARKPAPAMPAARGPRARCIVHASARTVGPAPHQPTWATEHQIQPSGSVLGVIERHRADPGTPAPQDRGRTRHHVPATDPPRVRRNARMSRQYPE